MQGIVDGEIRELKRIKWEDVKKEVSLIITHHRRPHGRIEKYGIP
jgi:hypothetical protein